MTTYYIAVRKTGTAYGYSIRDGRNSTIAWRRPWTRFRAKAERAAHERVDELIAIDRSIGRRSWRADADEGADAAR